VRCLLLASLLVVTPAALSAAGADIAANQDRLLCPAELLVVRADALRLTSASVTAAEKRGLRNRITTALATLPWICRRYAEVADVSDSSAQLRNFHDTIQILNELVEQPTALIESLADLITTVPMPLASFRFDQPGNKDESEMQTVYQNYCHGCHANTDLQSENPAYALDIMARERDEAEFFARMLLGVRGTADIGLSNPLTAIEIGAMTRYLRNRKP